MQLRKDGATHKELEKFESVKECSHIFYEFMNVMETQFDGDVLGNTLLHAVAMMIYENSSSKEDIKEKCLSSSKFIALHAIKWFEESEELKQ
jgi:hypothetical protein